MDRYKKNIFDINVLLWKDLNKFKPEKRVRTNKIK